MDPGRSSLLLSSHLVHIVETMAVRTHCTASRAPSQLRVEFSGHSLVVVYERGELLYKGYKVLRLVPHLLHYTHPVLVPLLEEDMLSLKPNSKT